jgi:ubiquinone/menaquinone biosynthesis C-methylase UbiE
VNRGVADEVKELNILPSLVHSYAAPFDSIADSYDDAFTFSAIGLAQRGSVWRKLEKSYCSGDRVLEVGCGTGIDACHLARRGVHVLACDSSSQMIAVANRRVKKEGLQEFVETIVLRAEEMGGLAAQRPFDGAFSNFGALNCIPDLPELAANLARMVKPGGKILLCYLGDCCLWEMAWYLASARPRKAFRRFLRYNEARVADGTPLQVYYPSVRAVKRAFAPEFSLKCRRGVGVLVPPSYLERWASHFPGLLRAAGWGDSWLGSCPGIRRLADHILLEFERRGN